MAAFDVATAKITGQMHEHHRSAEFLVFLGRVAAGIETCIEHHNANDARPFCRSKKPGDFVELVEPWERDTRSCRNRHREKETSHWAAGGSEVWKTMNIPM